MAPLGAYGQMSGMPGMAGGSAEGPKKIFVGSLPDGCSEMMLRAEYSKYGHITEVFMKTGCEIGRQWAFLTFATSQEAQVAKTSTDGILMMPGSPKACEVTYAKNQGLFGQDASGLARAQAPGAAYAAVASQGPKKIFVGSLPDDVTDAMMRGEFSKYGQVTDVYIKAGCESGRQWSFVTFSSSEAAQLAKDSTDRKLIMPGADKVCEVTLARNQGKFGQEAIAPGPQSYAGFATPPAAVMHGGHQPPPPTAHPPAHLTPWRCYYTAAGLPYYHNHTTGVTQWEAPPELRTPGDHLGLAAAAGVRYAPY